MSPAFWATHSSWSDDVRLAALYLTTSPHRTTEGLFRLPLAYAATDMGWPPERFNAAFEQLRLEGFVEYDELTSTCLLVDALSMQAPENPNQASAAVRAVAELPPTPLLQRLVALADVHSERFAEALRARFPQSPSPSPSPSPTPMQGSLVASDELAHGGDRGGRRSERAEERRIFDAWVKATQRTPNTALDEARRRVIRRAIRLKGVEAVLAAVEGVARSEHHMSKRQWSELRVVLRDAGQIEHFESLHQAAAPTELREAQILEAYSSRREQFSSS